MTATFNIQYFTNLQGQKQGVQMSLKEWEKVMTQLRHYEQLLQLKSDLNEAMQEVKLMQDGKLKKQSLTDFLQDV
jgi:hypothetical protein